MTTLNKNIASVEDSWEILWKGWELSQVNYRLALIISGLFSLSFLLNFIPFLGSLMGGVIASVAPLCFMQAASFWEEGIPSSITEIIEKLKNEQMISRMLPLVLLHFAVTAGPNFLIQLPGIGVAFAGLHWVLFPVGVVVSLAYPILYFNPDFTFKSALQFSVEGILANLLPFIVGGLMMIALMTASLAFFVFPFFLIGIPVLISYMYLWYRFIFENLQLPVSEKKIF